MREHEVLIVVPEHGLLVEVAGLCDLFNRANKELPAESTCPRYRWQIASTTADKIAVGSSGLPIIAHDCLLDMDPRRRFDTIIVTGGGGSERPFEVAEVADWIRLAAPNAQRIASVCSGVFLLAQAGLLSGRRATTHWKCTDELARRYPDVYVEANPIFVQDGNIFTSAGATAGFDLALAFVESDMGSTVARAVARDFVIYLRRPGGQSQYSVALERQAQSPGPIRDLQLWVMDRLDQDLRVERLANQVAMSPRNFARVFTEEVGLTPARYVEELRVEAAKRRLAEADDTMECIAADCGLGTAANFRKTFHRYLGVSPHEYRDRFGRI